MSIRYAFTVILVAAAVGSAIGVVRVQHERRALFSELQRIERDRDALEVEWNQLRLERSAWAADERIESLASGKLDMLVPAPGAVVLVTP